MPGDTKPHKARQARKRRRAAGSLDDARRVLWSALTAAETILDDATEQRDAPTVLKAVHALTQATAAYARVVEAGELEARLAEVEAHVAAHQTTDADAP